jgi:hypothetical protein
MNCQEAIKQASIHRAISHLIDAEIELELAKEPEAIKKVADVRHYLYGFIDMADRETQSVGEV